MKNDAKLLDPYDAIFVPEGAYGTYIEEIDRLLKSGKVKGWLQVVVLMTEDKNVHILPQGYGIPPELAENALKLGHTWQYAPEA